MRGSAQTSRPSRDPSSSSPPSPAPSLGRPLSVLSSRSSPPPPSLPKRIGFALHRSVALPHRTLCCGNATRQAGTVMPVCAFALCSGDLPQIFLSKLFSIRNFFAAFYAHFPRPRGPPSNQSACALVRAGTPFAPPRAAQQCKNARQRKGIGKETKRRKEKKTQRWRAGRSPRKGAARQSRENHANAGKYVKCRKCKTPPRHAANKRRTFRDVSTTQCSCV